MVAAKRSMLERPPAPISIPVGSPKKLSPVLKKKSPKTHKQKLSPAPNAKLSPALNKNLSPGSNDKLSTGSNDKLSPGSNDKLSPGSNEKLSQGSNEKLSQGSKKNISPGVNKKFSPGTNKKLSPRPKKKLPPGQNYFNPCYWCRCFCGGTCSLRTGCIVGGIIQLLIGTLRIGATIVLWLWIVRKYMRNAEREANLNHAQLESAYEAAAANGTLTQQIVLSRRNLTVSKVNEEIELVFLNAVIYDGVFTFTAILILIGAFRLWKWVCLAYTSTMIILMFYRTLRQVLAVQAVYHAAVLLSAFKNHSMYLGNIGTFMSDNTYAPLIEYLVSILIWFWPLTLCGGALFYQIHRGDYTNWKSSGKKAKTLQDNASTGFVLNGAMQSGDTQS